MEGETTRREGRGGEAVAGPGPARPAPSRPGGRAALPVDPDTELEDDREDPPPARPVHASPMVVGVVALSGAAGALARYGVEAALPVEVGHFPFATLWVNCSGSLAIGFVLIVLAERFPRSRLARPVAVTGFLGGYTTFSTFAVEAIELGRHHRPVIAVAYLVASLFGGLAAVIAGMAVGRAVTR